jgi:hypothetical protein
MLGSAGSGPFGKRKTDHSRRKRGVGVLGSLDFLIRNHIPGQEKKWMVRAGAEKW